MLAPVELHELRRRVGEQISSVQRRLAELAKQRAARQQEARVRAGLEEFCASILDALVDPPFATKQQVLQLVVDRVVVEDERIVVERIVPTGWVRW